MDEIATRGVCGAEGSSWPWCVDCIHQNKTYIGGKTSKEIEYDGRQCELRYRREEGAPYPDDF